MLNLYSSNLTIAADASVPFNSTSLVKGCTATLTSPDTIALNRKGIYEVTFNASVGASSTFQLYVNGVAQPQAISTGITPSFTTLVQVREDNCNCNCLASPTTLQVFNTGSATATADIVSIVITKYI